jgi:hypothetical protein
MDHLTHGLAFLEEEWISERRRPTPRTTWACVGKSDTPHW